jgi:glycosyltransferase involved in cell wall biosynthesis
MSDVGQTIICFATQGDNHTDADRLRHLLEPLHPEGFRFDRSHRVRSAIRLFASACARRPALIIMEGTGIAGGLTLIAIDILLGIPFIVSSGDAVGPYLRLRSRLAGIAGEVYERLLCRRCAAYVGWTPYLVGRSLTLGARRAATAPGWTRSSPTLDARATIRDRLGIESKTLVFGIVGALNWRERTGYVYGAELVRAICMTDRRDVAVCIVGDGSGLQRLAEMAGDELGRRVILVGRVPPADVPDYLAAFDVASLPQSVDQVGSFRYSTKLSEYLAAELPIVTGQIPAAYDLDEGWIWRLPGATPWSETYVRALASLMGRLGWDEVMAKRSAISRPSSNTFNYEAQRNRVCGLIEDILEERRLSGRQ